MRRYKGVLLFLAAFTTLFLVTLHFHVSRTSSKATVRSGRLLAQQRTAEQKNRGSKTLTLLQTEDSKSEEKHDKSTPETKSADEEEIMALILKRKLSEFPSEKAGLTKRNCERTKSASAPCLNTTCPAKFSSSPEVRLKQILSTRNESIRTLKAVMAEVTRQVSASYKYVLVTAVSANHYKEMQAMVKNVQTELMPRLTSFIFIIFDLGLTSLQRNMTEKNCRCTVLDYPFKKLPDFFSILRCYTWKPTIISSLIEKAEFLVWMDASVRWNSESPIDRIFERCKERGIQLGFSSHGSIGVRTNHETFRFYGDEPCMYEAFGEVWATYGVYHNEPFVRHVVLDSWLSCALSRHCMCLKGYHRMFSCRQAKFPRRMGVCHRFDQSSLGIILGKLYGDRINLIRISKGVNAHRGNTSNWFTK